jgi:hypothetical protein
MHGPVANELGQRVVAYLYPAGALLPNEEQLSDIELASRPWNVLKIWALLGVSTRSGDGFQCTLPDHQKVDESLRPGNPQTALHGRAPALKNRDGS